MGRLGPLGDPWIKFVKEGSCPSETGQRHVPFPEMLCRRIKELLVSGHHEPCPACAEGETSTRDDMDAMEAMEPSRPSQCGSAPTGIGLRDRGRRQSPSSVTVAVLYCTVPTLSRSTSFWDRIRIRICHLHHAALDGGAACLEAAGTARSSDGGRLRKLAQERDELALSPWTLGDTDTLSVELSRS